MSISLTYPFNIVQYTLSHIVEHRKLDSLATPDNIYDQLRRHVGPATFANLTQAYHTQLNGKPFIIDLFTYNGKQELLGKISMGQFSAKLVDRLVGVLRQRNQGC